MNHRAFSKVESGTCNVCSAPCSSCMHRNLGFAGSKSEESSDENCHGVAGTQCSVNEDGLLPSSMVNPRNSSHKTASEASNIVNSSRDTLSENSESKESIRCSGISDDAGAVALNSEASFSGSRRKHEVSESANVLAQSSNCIEGQEDGILSDDQSKKSGHPNNKIVNKDPAEGSSLISDPILGGLRKEQDSTMIEPSNDLSNKVKSQSLHNSPSNHDERTSSKSGNTKEKLGSGGNEDKGKSSVEGSTPSGQNGKDGKSSKSTSGNTSDESIPSAMSESESDDSIDVKVCDICGDAGREDLLAICSRCSDGAEHTYCMRERLNAVPEGDWHCEECKFAEEAEKQKQEAKIKRETEVTLNTHSSGKRHADKTEAAPDAKRQTVEGSTGSPKKSVLPRIGALLRETSFKGLDRSRGKLNHQTSFSDGTEGARSTGSQLQPPKGAFLKSSSFNCSSSKPRVQLMDDVIVPRQKTGKEYTSLDRKEGGLRHVGKSMSSRTTDAGSSSGKDSQAKMLPSKIYHSQEGKSSKQLKDRSTEANASASSTDQKLTSRGNLSASYANNSRDLKGLQSDGRRGSLTKQVSNLNRYHDSVASGGDLSTNEKCSASEQSSSQADCKDELPSTSCSDEGVPSYGNGASQRPKEFIEVGKKSKDAFGKRQRSSLLSGAKGLPSSQKGGQITESSETSGVSDSDLSTTKNVRDDINKGNRLRAAVDAALRKKPNFGKNKALEQSDGTLVSNVDSSSDKTLRNQLPSKMPTNLWPASDPYKQTIVVSGAEVKPPRSVELEVNFPSAKPVTRDWPLVAPPSLLRSSAIPDHESIWQGDLEVRKTRNQSAMHSGMQAHLSTLASPKVAEVVNKFPEKFSLIEVPRLSTWPAQFQDIGTKEDHIALFFFAKDVESYERNYKPLVDTMIKKDLALKGNLDNVELLIFASNQLPPNCQRWNMLYFLWGVFRGRKEISTNPQKNTSLPTSNVIPRDRDPIDLCQTSSPSKHLEKAPSLRESSQNIIETQNRTDVFSNENPSDRESSIERSSSTKEENVVKEDQPSADHVPCQATGSNSGDSLVKKVQQIEEQELGDRKDLPLTVSGSEIQSRGQDSLIGKDLNCSQANRRKRAIWELTRPAAENQKVELSNDSLCEGSPSKKPKTENESSSLSRDNDSGIMKKSPEVVFPLDLNAEREDIEMVDDLIPLYNNNNNNNNNNKRQLSGTVPNLELALGAEETGQDTMGLLPFLAGRRNISGEQSSSNSMMNKEKKKEEDDDDDVADAGSLSLSLSFPGEERKNVNTPMFLFRDLTR
uniref:Lysine-specific demethylase 5B n=1 Tax=Noccaea caerulescens TaxID=107243 RepID=A0A1J3EGG5_NOCCA